MNSSARTVALTLSGLALLAAVPTTAHAGAGHSTSPVLTIPPPAPPSVVGSSTLVRTDNGLSTTVQTSGLTPGHVVTLWWVVANSPEECESGLPGLSQCGPEDHVAGRGDMSVHHAAGRIVDDDGTAEYGAHLRVGDLSRALFENEPGLVDPRGAEVLLVLKTHGPKIPGRTADMLRTFAGGCRDQALPPQLTPRPEVFGTEGPNECSEIHITVHRPAS